MPSSIDSSPPNIGRPSSLVLSKVDQLFSHADAWLNKSKRWLVAATLLLALQAALTATHDHWLDEWHALQIAIQSPDFLALLENLRYEGHPPLWYGILRMAAHIVPVLWTLAVVQLLIALVMQALILFRSPFSRFERLLISYSYFILFEFGALSRSLSLGAMLLIAFFSIRNRLNAWAIVTLLPMVDFQFGLLSIVAMILLAKDARWSWIGAGAWLISSLLSAASVRPAPDMIPALPTSGPIKAIFDLLNNLSVMAVPFHTMDREIAWPGGLPGLLGLIIGPIFIAWSLREAFRVSLHGVVFAAFFAASCLFSLIVYPLGIRHLTLIPLLLILLKWREIDMGLGLRCGVRIWFLLIACGGLAVIPISVSRPFDQAPQAASHIRTHGLQNKLWVAWPDSRGEGISAILGIDMYTLKKGCTQSFIRWNFRDGIENRRQLTSALIAATQKYGRIYLVTDKDLSRLSGDLIQPLILLPPGYDGYRYNLYVVGPRLPETSHRPPPCPPARLPLH